MAAWAVNRDQRPFASPYRTVAPERSVTSVVVYCLRKPRRRRVKASDSRSQIRGRDKSVLDDITSCREQSACGRSFATHHFWKSGVPSTRTHAAIAIALTNGKLHHGRVASSVRLLEKSWRNAEADGSAFDTSA